MHLTHDLGLMYLAVSFEFQTTRKKIRPVPDHDSLLEELPEVTLLADPREQERVAQLWLGFLAESTYDAVSDAPAFPGLHGYDLARHTRQVVQNCLALAHSMVGCWGITY